MSRAKMISQVREALSKSNPPGIPTELPPFPEYLDPVKEFVTQARLVDVNVHLVDEPAALSEAVQKILEQTGCQDLYWESPEIFERHGIEVRFRDPAGFGAGKLMSSRHHRGRFELPVVLNTKPYRRAILTEIELGAVSADWGVAETGSLGIQLRPGKGRLFAILPPRILVFIRGDAILSNLPQVLESHNPSETGSILTLVTGPSRTADIEKTLVIGVHGPKEVHVIVTSAL